MNLIIEARGDIVEREELLNGTQIVTIEGASDDGGWSVGGTISWNIGLDVRGVEGDVTFTRADGAAIFGTVTGGRVEARDAEDAGVGLRLEYDVDGGSGALEGARGAATAEGVLSGESFRCAWRVTLEDALRSS